MSVLRELPGLRSPTRWKKAAALAYYGVALLVLWEGAKQGAGALSGSVLIVAGMMLPVAAYMRRTSLPLLASPRTGLKAAGWYGVAVLATALTWVGAGTGTTPTPPRTEANGSVETSQPTLSHASLGVIARHTPWVRPTDRPRATYTPWVRPTDRARATEKPGPVTLSNADCPDCTSDISLWQHAMFPRPLAGQPNSEVGGFPVGTSCQNLGERESTVQDGGQTRGVFVKVKCNGVTGWVLEDFVK